MMDLGGERTHRNDHHHCSNTILPIFLSTFVFRRSGCWLREEQLARMVPKQPVRVLAKDYSTLIHTSASFSGSTINLYDHKSTMGNQHQRHFHASHSYLAVFFWANNTHSNNNNGHIVGHIFSISGAIFCLWAYIGHIFRIIACVHLRW